MNNKLKETLETRVTRRVKAMYYNKPHQLGLLWHNKPFEKFNPEWFEECFRAVALEHGHKSLSHLTTLTKAQMGYQRWYDRLHNEVLKRFRVSLKRLKEHSQDPPRREQVIQETSFPGVKEKERHWSPTIPATHPTRTRLQQLRDELAARRDASR